MSHAFLARLQVAILQNSLGLTPLNMLKKGSSIVLTSLSILFHSCLSSNSLVDLLITSNFNEDSHQYSTAFQTISHFI